MITINVISNQFGNNRQYIARITGRASKFTFQREFVGRKSGKRNEYTEYSTDAAGLYEDCDISRQGEKVIGYWLVADTPDGLVKLRASLEDAMKIARRLDEGETLESMLEIKPEQAGWIYELRSKSEAKAAIADQTIESAIEGCWAIMQALPAREVKKVLAALRLRVSPVSPAKPETETVSEAQNVEAQNVEALRVEKGEE